MHVSNTVKRKETILVKRNLVSALHLCLIYIAMIMQVRQLNFNLKSQYFAVVLTVIICLPEHNLKNEQFLG